MEATASARMEQPGLEHGTSKLGNCLHSDARRQLLQQMQAHVFKPKATGPKAYANTAQANSTATTRTLSSSAFSQLLQAHVQAHVQREALLLLRLCLQRKHHGVRKSATLWRHDALWRLQ